MPFETLTLNPRMRKFAKVRYAAGVCMVLVLLSGCGGLGTRGESARLEFESAARTLLAEQRYTEAADEYLRLASLSRPPASHEYVIKAAAALVDGGDMTGARNLLSERLPAELETGARTSRDVVLARIALAEREPAKALGLLPPGMEASAPAALHSLILQYRAAALAGLGRHLDAARERVALSPLLPPGPQLDANHRALWESISQLTPQELSGAATTATGTMAGWVELAAIAQQSMTDPDALSRGLEGWRQRFPGHPAESLVVPELELLARTGPARPERIALMLPLRGGFAAAAAAIRDGFLSAWLEDQGGTGRPAITIVDTTDADILTLYRQTVDQGAQFVVGPLDKTAVTVMAAETGLPVTTLALNYAEESPPTAAPSSTAVSVGALPSPTAALTPPTSTAGLEPRCPREPSPKRFHYRRAAPSRPRRCSTSSRCLQRAKPRPSRRGPGSTAREEWACLRPARLSASGSPVASSGSGNRWVALWPRTGVTPTTPATSRDRSPICSTWSRARSACGDCET